MTLFKICRRSDGAVGIAETSAGRSRENLEEIMRLELVQKALKEKGIPYNYTEEDGCGSIDFLFRGIPYHVWEFEDDGWGAETNIENSGRSEDIVGDYERKIAGMILGWPEMVQG